MQVILTDDVLDLGKRGDVVKVTDGYARNFLIPRRLAVLVTPGNMKMVEQQRISLAKKEAKLKEEAQVLARELEQLHLVFSRKSGETGALFGSVTSKDISDLLHQEGVMLDRRRVLLDPPIKSVGNFNVEVHPHSEVTTTLMVSVIPEEEQVIQRVKRKDPESDAIVATVDAHLRRMSEAAAHAAAAVSKAARQAEEPPAVHPAEAKARKPKTQRKEGRKTEAE